MIYKYYLEIKNRFILLFFTWCFSILITYIYKEVLLFIIVKPNIFNYNNVFYFIFTDIREIFSIYIKLCIFISNQTVIIWLIFQCFNFLSTGLYYFEYKYLKKIIFISFILWISLFTMFNKFLIPISLNFFLSFQGFMSFTIHFEAKIIEYLNFYYFFYSVLIFYYQLLIVTIIFFDYINFNLNLIKKYRKLFYFLIFLLTTLITPPDVTYQIIFSTMFIFFYELLNLIKFLRQLSFHMTHWIKNLKTYVYTQAIEGFFNVLKSKLTKKKGFTYEELCKNTETVLKEIPQKTYQNLLWGCYFKPYKSN